MLSSHKYHAYNCLLLYHVRNLGASMKLCLSRTRVNCYFNLMVFLMHADNTLRIGKLYYNIITVQRGYYNAYMLHIYW